MGKQKDDQYMINGLGSGFMEVKDDRIHDAGRTSPHSLKKSSMRKMRLLLVVPLACRKFRMRLRLGRGEGIIDKRSGANVAQKTKVE